MQTKQGIMKGSDIKINLAVSCQARYSTHIMSTSVAFSRFITIPDAAVDKISEVTCHDVQKACMPSFVFSVSGQTKFRAALDHLLTCQKRECSILRRKVKDGMRDKLQWLFQEDVLLGCVHVQPFLYGSSHVRDVRQQRHFMPVAEHLAMCPHESCARLRRSLLLKVRDFVSPANNIGN